MDPKASVLPTTPQRPTKLIYLFECGGMPIPTYIEPPTELTRQIFVSLDRNFNWNREFTMSERNIPFCVINKFVNEI